MNKEEQRIADIVSAELDSKPGAFAESNPRVVEAAHEYEPKEGWTVTVTATIAKPRKGDATVTVETRKDDALYPVSVQPLAQGILDQL